MASDVLDSANAAQGQGEGGAERAYRLRYREPLKGRAAWTDTLEVLASHKSIRAYKPDPVTPETLRTLITAAQSAPSSSNLQFWSVVAVEDPERKARLAEYAGNQAHIANCPLFLVWIVDLARHEAFAKVEGISDDGLDYLESFVVGVVDATLAAQNLLTAAESLGLGGVYIGGMRNHPLEVSKELHLPPRTFAVFGMCLGYPVEGSKASVKPRLPQEVVLHHEHYTPAEQQLAGVMDYNAKARAFQEEQGMRIQDWTKQAATRMRGPEALSNRHVLREVLNRLGFQLK